MFVPNQFTANFYNTLNTSDYLIKCENKYNHYLMQLFVKSNGIIIRRYQTKLSNNGSFANKFVGFSNFNAQEKINQLHKHVYLRGQIAQIVFQVFHNNQKIQSSVQMMEAPLMDLSNLVNQMLCLKTQLSSQKLKRTSLQMQVNNLKNQIHNLKNKSSNATISNSIKPQAYIPPNNSMSNYNSTYSKNRNNLYRPRNPKIDKSLAKSITLNHNNYGLCLNQLRSRHYNQKQYKADNKFKQKADGNPIYPNNNSARKSEPIKDNNQSMNRIQDSQSLRKTGQNNQQSSFGNPVRVSLDELQKFNMKKEPINRNIWNYSQSSTGFYQNILSMNSQKKETKHKSKQDGDQQQKWQVHSYCHDDSSSANQQKVQTFSQPQINTNTNLFGNNRFNKYKQNQI